MTAPATHPAPHVLAAITSEPWAILPGSLELILEIASRRGDPEAIAVKRGQSLESARSVEVRDGVAIIPIMGPIFPRASMFESISQAAVSVETLALNFQQALDDPSVRAIVFNIDSPGGQVSGVQELAAQVAAARGVKPMIAYIQGTGASAAYWLASSAPRIVVAQTAIVGSIGVVATVPKTDGKTLSIVSSRAPKKRVDPETEDGRAEIVRTLDDIAGIFAGHVAANRGTTIENVEQNFGQGGVLVGARAVAAGMADALGTLEGVIAELSAPVAVVTARPLAGNLKAQGENVMLDAQKPDAGGGQTAAANPPVISNPIPKTDAAIPTTVGVLAIVGALHGPDVRASVEQAVNEAQASGLSCVAYAALLTGMRARFGVAPQAAQEDQTAQAPNGGQAMVNALTAAMANPSQPGTVKAGQQPPDFVAYTKAHLGKGGK